MRGLAGETFGGTFPFPPRYRSINGFEMHYVDEGAGEPIVMLHGDPTWGYLYRAFVPTLARRARCVVPDHMGMGKSEVPNAPYPYRLEHHRANLEALLLALDLDRITLVVHDWGGPVGFAFAIRHPARIKRLVIMNTWASALWPGGTLPRLLEIIRSSRGERFVLEKNGYVEPALVGTTYRREHLTPAVLDAYRAPFPTPESRLALVCWTRDIPLAETDPSYAEMKRIETELPKFARVPVLLLWGMRDPVLTPAVLGAWQRQFPHAVTHELEDAGHFLQEDAPVDAVRAIGAFLDRHP